MGKELTITDVRLFGKGLMRWCNNGDIDLFEFREGKRMNTLLTTIFNDENLYGLDEDFNQMSIAEVEELISNRKNEYICIKVL